MNRTIRTIHYPSGQVLELVHGDLTEEKVDAIVNAANSHLAHGSGVAGAISSRGGPAIQAESSAWVKEHGPVSHEKPAYTGPGKLPCRYVIHAVGPIWGSGDEDRKLAAAVRGSLERADELGLATLAIPPISTGIFGFPRDRAARIFTRVIREYFQAKPASGLTQVRLTIIDQGTLTEFEPAWEEQDS